MQRIPAGATRTAPVFRLLVIGAILLVIPMFTGACGERTDPDSASTTAADVSPDRLREMTERAYVFTYPLLESYRHLYAHVVKARSRNVRPFNRFEHQTRPAATGDGAVRPNPDTLTSTAWLDLRAEPVVLTVPRVEDGRYQAFGLLDLSTHTLGYVGLRTSGTEGGSYLITGPTWDAGAKPKGILKVFRSESQFVRLRGGIAVGGEADLPFVLALQKSYRLEPLSDFLDEPVPQAPPALAWPIYEPEAAGSFRFVKYANFLLGQMAVEEGEREMIERWQPLGVAPGVRFDTAQIQAPIRALMDEGVESALAKIENATLDLRRPNNGWVAASRARGSRESAEPGRQLERAATARLALLADSSQEVYSLTAQLDGEGETLDAGGRGYALQFKKEELPAARAFWSLALYTLPDETLHENPINRYAVGSRSKSLVYDSAGGLTLTIQPESPGPEREANWLPAPAGPFVLQLRMYWPEPGAVTAAYVPPPVLPTGGEASERRDNGS